MTDLEVWLNTLDLRDPIREKLVENLASRSLLKLDDVALRKSDTEFWKELYTLCEMNLGEKSRFKGALSDLQLRVCTEVDEWLKPCQLRTSVVDYVVVNQGFTRKIEILFYRSDKEALVGLCKSAGMSLGERARFMQAVESLGEEPTAATQLPSLQNPDAPIVNSTPEKPAPSSASNLNNSVAPDANPSPDQYETVVSVIGRDLYRREVVEAVIRHTPSIDIAVQTLLFGIHEQTWLDKDKGANKTDQQAPNAQGNDGLRETISNALSKVSNMFS